jgi:hypothetical protein
MSTILARSKAQESQRLLGILALTIAGLSALKYFAILAVKPDSCIRRGSSW